MWIYSLIFLELLCLIWYIRLFVQSTKAWSGENDFKGDADPTVSVSVLVAMRNERENLPELLRSLKAQTHANLEVLLIDDHSTDGSVAWLNEVKQDYSFLKLGELPQGQSGKKSALSYGVNRITSEWVICTDADCQVQPEWISSILAYAREKKKYFVSGPVQFNTDKSWFGSWQALEFSGLITLGAAAIFRNKPTMCNGANILYKKDVFHEIGGYKGNDAIASGDDQFLMHRIHAKYPDKVGFCKDSRAIVYTRPVLSLSDFISQRIRWASKSGQFERKEVSWEMAGVWLLTFFIVSNAFLSFWRIEFLIALVILLLGKGFIEYQFYRKSLPFYAMEHLKRNFWLSEVFQVIYVFCIGLLGKFVPYRWKGRK